MENIPTSYNPHSSRLHISFLRHSLTHTHKHVECTVYTQIYSTRGRWTICSQCFAVFHVWLLRFDSKWLCITKTKQKKTSHRLSLYQGYNIVDDWQYEMKFLSGTTFDYFAIYIYTLKAFFSRMKYGQPLRSELNFGLHLCLFVCWYLFRIVLKSVRKWKSGATDDSCK